MYQDEKTEKDILMNLTPKFIEENDDLVIEKFLSNRFITVKDFMEKYFEDFKRQKIDIDAQGS